MHEINCPHCGKAFKIDEAGYADILKQVRDGEFEQQLHDRLELAEQDKRNAVELAKTQVANESHKAEAAKDAEIQDLKAKLDAGEVARGLAVRVPITGLQSLLLPMARSMWLEAPPVLSMARPTMGPGTALSPSLSIHK